MWAASHSLRSQEEADMTSGESQQVDGGPGTHNTGSDEPIDTAERPAGTVDEDANPPSAIQTMTLATVVSATHLAIDGPAIDDAVPIHRVGPPLDRSGGPNLWIRGRTVMAARRCTEEHPGTESRRPGVLWEEAGRYALLV
jgi:hypothetical protein